MDADYWINKLGLEKHPEGGYFKEVYRSRELIPQNALPDRYGGPRSFGTSIYFLLRGQEVSKLHRIKSDELWHYYTGSSLTVHVLDLDPQGVYTTERLGGEPEKGEVFQTKIDAGCWFGASVDDSESFSLVGCTVSPGFDFDDFELGDREELLRLYPVHTSVIERFAKKRQ